MIDVGKGYRQLEPMEEFLQIGDEWALNRRRRKLTDWRRVGDHAIGMRVPNSGYAIYRRPISQEKTEADSLNSAEATSKATHSTSESSGLQADEPEGVER